MTERKEIDKIFQKYADAEGFMSCQNLVRFLYETQQEEDAVVAAPPLIQRYEPNELGRLETLVGLGHNLAILMNSELLFCCFLLQLYIYFFLHAVGYKAVKFPWVRKALIAYSNGKISGGLQG